MINEFIKIVELNTKFHIRSNAILAKTRLTPQLPQASSKRGVKTFLWACEKKTYGFFPGFFPQARRVKTFLWGLFEKKTWDF